MKKKKIKSSSAKAKGRRFQQWVCKKLSDYLSIPWGKDELIASREMGQSGTDVRLLGTTKILFPFSVECKWRESWSVPEYIKQAKDNKKAGTDWLLFLKRNHEPPVVVMDAEAFFRLHFKRDMKNLKAEK